MKMSFNCNANLGSNGNINFKGGVITPWGNDFSPVILRAYYKDPANDSEGQRNIPLVINDWKSDKAVNPEGNKLTLWGKDGKLFSEFLKKHKSEIPALPKELGFTLGTDLYAYHIHWITSTKLAQALTKVMEIPQVLTREAVTGFICKAENLTREILTEDMLKRALESIIAKK